MYESPTKDWVIATENHFAPSQSVFALLDQKSCLCPQDLHCDLRGSIRLVISNWGAFIMNNNVQVSACSLDCIRQSQN